MGYRPQSYADSDPSAAMLLDARRAAEVLPLRAEVPARPSQADKVKREISVDAAAFRLAVALDL